MTVSFRANEDGSASVLLAGVERLKINADGSMTASASSAAGVRGNVLATMASFAAEFTSAFTQSGWLRLPNGLILQWGTSVSDASGIVIATYPIAFPTTMLALVCNAFVGGTTVAEASGSTWNNSGLANPKTQVRLVAGRAVASTFCYFSVGF